MAKQKKISKIDFKPLVSIIIPVYNGEDYIAEAIDSALAQTYKNIEIIIVNDGSTDKTERICKLYGNKVDYYYKTNGGVASALNYGIRKSKGEFISWLSHDDIYYKHKIEKQIQILNNLRNKNTIIFSNIEYIDSKGNIISKSNITKNINPKDLCNDILPVLRGVVNGCSTIINKTCFNKVGLFNVDLKTASDYDMWFRLFKSFPSYFSEDYLIQYRIHSKQGTQTIKDYFKESDDLWSRIISDLTMEKITKITNDPFQEIMSLFYRMREAKLFISSQKAYDLAKIIYSKTKVEISVIMPCYNEQLYIKRAIKSILNQTYTNFELIIIDDKSTDDSYKIAKDYSEKDFRVKVYKNNNTKGVAGALNTGLYNAKGKYITRQDADDTSSPDRLMIQQNVFKQDSNVGYCATNISFINEHNALLDNTYRKPIGPIEFELAFLNPIPNATIMFKNDLIKKHDLTFNKYKSGEDYDFLIRFVLNTKSKGVFLSEKLYSYRILKDSLFHSNKKSTINLSYKLGLEYFKNIYPEAEKNSYNLLQRFINKNIAIDDYKGKSYFYYKYMVQCEKFFDWGKYDIEKAMKYIVSDPDLFHAEKQVIVSDNEKIAINKKPTIFIKISHKINYYYKINGFSKTLLWLLFLPIIKVFRSIKND